MTSSSAAPATSPARGGFAARLRAATRVAHAEAEGSAFLDDLLAGRLSPAAHAAMLAALHPVYAALEDAGRALAGDPLAAAFLDPRLVRLPALEADLAQLLGAGWRDALGDVGPVAAGYAARLRAAADDPVVFVVHHYLRYLGDLSGGQAVAALLARAYDLPPACLGFYAFDLAPAPYRTRYRALLDAAPLDPGQQDAFVAEAGRGYALNRAVLDELGARWRAS